MPLLLEEFEASVETAQRDIVLEVATAGDLRIDQAAGFGDARIAIGGGGAGAPLQIGDLGLVARVFLKRQHQAADKGRFLDRTGVRLRQRSVGGKIVVIEHGELVVDRAGHQQAQRRRRAHQDKEPDGDTKNLNADGQPHRWAVVSSGATSSTVLRRMSRRCARS